MKKIPVDVTIYVQDMKSYILDYSDYDEMLDQYGIENRNRFEELLEESLMHYALDAYQKSGSAELNLKDFDECLGYAVSDYHLEALQEKGLLEVGITEDFEIGYRATPAGHIASLLNNIHYN
jgi:glycyl-tRNA synthetase (class II)